MKSFIIAIALTLTVSSIAAKMAPLKVVVKDDAAVNTAAKGWVAAMATLDTAQRAFHSEEPKIFKNIQATTKSVQAAFETGKNAFAKWQAIRKIRKANRPVISKIRAEVNKLKAARAVPRNALQAAWKNLMAKGRAAFTAARTIRQEANKKARAARIAARKAKNTKRRLAAGADKWCSSQAAGSDGKAFCDNFNAWAVANNKWTTEQLSFHGVEFKEFDELKACAAGMTTAVAAGKGFREVRKAAHVCLKAVRNGGSKKEIKAQDAARKASGTAMRNLWKQTVASFRKIRAARKAANAAKRAANAAKRAAKGKKRSA